jgi:hypothetical protein
LTQLRACDDLGPGGDHCTLLHPEPCTRLRGPAVDHVEIAIRKPDVSPTDFVPARLAATTAPML